MVAGRSDAELAANLGCSAEALTMFRLCRAPRQGDDGAEDVRCVAVTWPGAYRLEAWLELDGEFRPWIFANPIYVR
jgi:hypothetical protein